MIPDEGLDELGWVRLGGVVLAGASGAVVLRLIDRDSRRLADLEKMARGIEDGDFGVRADESGRGVIARLSTSMNRMALRTQRVVADLEARDRSLHFLSNHDPLTGLPNRRLFLEFLGKELALARRV